MNDADQPFSRSLEMVPQPDIHALNRGVAPERRPPEEWCESYGLVVLDPDGWRSPDAPDWHEPISLAEFWERVARSTTNGLATGADQRIVADLKAASDG